MSSMFSIGGENSNSDMSFLVFGDVATALVQAVVSKLYPFVRMHLTKRAMALSVSVLFFCITSMPSGCNNG